jgi:hypothetical protein
MKLIGKLAIVAGSLAVSGISAGIVAVKKTEAGAKAWKSTTDFAVNQYDAAQGLCSKAVAKIEARYTSIKESAAKSGERKAFAEVAKDSALY